MKLSGRAKLAGVIGDPVSHSLSPRLHAYWLQAYGIDGVYLPLPVAKEAFALVLRGLRAAGFAGVNVTVPHKEAAFAVAERLDRMALATGAANLLVFHDGHMEGRNTDVTGLAASLETELGTAALRGKPVAVLGAGGAARAAAVAVQMLGASEIRIFARHRERADILVQGLSPFSISPMSVYPWDKWPQAASDIALLINATSAGLAGSPGPELALDVLPVETVVCDIVYNPLETAFLGAARALGHKTIDGLGMLMHQAVPAFEAFYGVGPAVTSGLRFALEEALRES